MELSKNVKLDFALVRGVQGRVITMGDIVSHNLPTNSFSQLVTIFEVLLGKPLRPLISKAVDRWATEIEGRPSQPIVPDFDKMASHLTRLFEVRHILCHELPAKPVYAVIEVSEFLNAAFQFTKAMEEVLTSDRFGRVPLTQTEMNIEAGKSLSEVEAQMASLIEQAQAIVKRFNAPNSSFSDDRLQSFNDAQGKWMAYRNAMCDFQRF